MTFLLFSVDSESICLLCRTNCGFGGKNICNEHSCLRARMVSPYLGHLLLHHGNTDNFVLVRQRGSSRASYEQPCGLAAPRHSCDSGFELRLLAEWRDPENYPW